MSIPWTGQTSDGTKVRVSIGFPLHPGAPEYTVYLNEESEPQNYRLQRHVDGTPTRVLTYVTPGTPGAERIGWIFDPHRQHLDPAGSLARTYLDGLAVNRLVEIGRKLAADETKAMQDELIHARRTLTHVERMLCAAQLVGAALALDDPEARTIALGLVPEWHGTPEGLKQAAADAAWVPPLL